MSETFRECALKVEMVLLRVEVREWRVDLRVERSWGVTRGDGEGEGVGIGVDSAMAGVGEVLGRGELLEAEGVEGGGGM